MTKLVSYLQLNGPAAGAILLAFARDMTLIEGVALTLVVWGPTSLLWEIAGYVRRASGAEG